MAGGRLNAPGMEELPLPSRTRVVFGENTVDGLGDLVRDLAAGAGRVLLVTDPGLVAIGHVARAEAALRAAGLDVHRHDAVRQNPDTTDVDACRDAITATNPDVLVGFGGGSTIDAAKGANFVFAGGGRMEDYWGKNKAKGTLLPLVAVPTTAGTGTELQSFALIQQASTHQKMACGDPQALPRLAVLDPTLTVTLPRDITACTALDTLGHAIETAVTRARTDTSAPLSGEAFRLVHAHLPEVLADPGDLASRGALLRAAEGHFDVFVTMDDNLPDQQHLQQFDLAVAILRARSKSLKDLLDLVPELEARLPDLQTGEAVRIYPTN